VFGRLLQEFLATTNFA